MSLNKVFLIGRLGTDPELRQTKGGMAVANFNVATNEYYNDKEGNKQEKTEWHKVVVWGKQADLCGQYLSKGRQVFIEGKLQTRQWDDQQGQKRYTTEVVASNVRFLDSKTDATKSEVNSGYNGAHGNVQDDYSSTAADDIPF